MLKVVKKKSSKYWMEKNVLYLSDNQVTPRIYYHYDILKFMILWIIIINGI